MIRFTALVGSYAIGLALGACGDEGAGARTDSQANDATSVDTADSAPTDSTPSADSTPADSAPPDTSPAVPSVSVQFVLALDGPGLPDVSIAWTPPGGSRVETMTDANGRIAFYDVDWTKGRALLVGFKDNFVIRGVLAGEAELDDPGVIKNGAGDVLLVVEPTARPTTITVSGTAAGVGAAEYLFIGTDLLEATQSVRPGSRFQLTVPPETPFNWTAFTWIQDGPFVERTISNRLDNWSAGTSPGGADDFVMDIDLVAQSLPVKTVSGSFPLFASDASGLDETGLVRVSVFGDQGLGYLGGVSKSSIAEGNTSASYELEWIEPEWVTSPLVVFSLDGNSELSQQAFAGWPTAGEQDVSLPVPPIWSSTTGTRPIDEPLTWTVGDPTGNVIVYVLLGTAPTARAGAVFNLPPGTTGFTLPELPGGRDYFEVSGVGILGAMILTCVIDPAIAVELCARYAHSKRTAIGPASP